MTLTLLEAAKKHGRGDVIRSAIIEIYARSTDILRVLPFDDIDGNAFKYNREEALPGVGFRGVNEGYTESTGVLNPQVEALVICGGDLDVDRFILKTMGQDQRSSQEAMKVKALAHTFSQKFIKGDSEASAKEFDGLQKRLTGTQVVSEGSTSGGDPLQLASLDALIDLVDEPTHLMMTKQLRRGLTAAARNTSVGGYITYSKDEFGRRVTQYNDLPILLGDGNGDANPALGNNETATGGGSTATSVYCLELGEGKLQGIQNGTMEVTDLGELEDKPSMRTRVEWYPGIILMHPRAAARLRDIDGSATVAV